MNNFLKSTYFIARVLNAFVIEGVSYLFIHNKYSRFIERITTSLVKTDVLFVKIIQSLAHSNHLIDDDTNNTLVRYTDRVPYTNLDLNDDVINHIKYKTSYTFVDSKIRSGMISLLYH